MQQQFARGALFVPLQVRQRRECGVLRGDRSIAETGGLA
jgi:hypothetical protein